MGHQSQEALLLLGLLTKLADQEVDELWNKYNRPRPMPKLGIPVIKLERIDKKLNKKPTGKTLKTKDIKTPRGSVNIHQCGIPVRTKCKVTLKCPTDGCTETFDLQKDLTAHVSGNHPTFRYNCEHCTKAFQS